MTKKSYLHGERSNPLHGWPLLEVLAFPGSPAAPNDLYGYLYYYLHHTLSTFSKNLASPIRIIITSFFAPGMHTFFPFTTNVPRSFDFIDVSNLTDHNYFGVSSILENIGKPLLKPGGILQGSFENYPAYGSDSKTTSKTTPAPAQDNSAPQAEDKTHARAMGYVNALHHAREPEFTGLESDHVTPFHPERYRLEVWGRNLSPWNEVWDAYIRKDSGIDLEGSTNAVKGFKVRKCLRPWQITRAEDQKGIMEKALEMEGRASGGIGGFETFVQWVRKGEAREKTGREKIEEVEMERMLDMLKMQRLMEMGQESRMWQGKKKFP